jgi:membrane dipeptidase
MKKFFKPIVLAVFVLSACDSNQTKDVTTMSEQELVERAKGIHERVITIDTHDDINTSNFTAETNYTDRLSSQVNLPKMVEGGLDVAWFVVYTGQGDLNEEGYAKAYENADDKFKAIHRLTEELAPDKIGLALTSDDVRSIVASGRKVAMIGVENAYPMGNDIARVKEFYDRGARYMSLAHNGHSQLSDSNTGERDSVWLHNGLSDLGRQAIAEMNKWGIMIDLSHPSKVANMEMMKLSKAPVIASHSSARALNDVPRNMDDEQLMMLKTNGGVIQTVAFKGYVNAAKNSANSEAANKIIAEEAEKAGFTVLERSAMRDLSADEREAYMAKYSEIRDAAAPRIEAEVSAIAPPVDVADFVDHIDYLVKKIGIEHVGISSDFDGGGGVEGWNDASETFNVTLELVRRGYSEEQIGMMWSGNLLRVLDEVQAVAKKIQAGE